MSDGCIGENIILRHNTIRPYTTTNPFKQKNSHKESEKITKEILYKIKLIEKAFKE